MVKEGTAGQWLIQVGEVVVYRGGICELLVILCPESVFKSSRKSVKAYIIFHLLESVWMFTPLALLPLA